MDYKKIAEVASNTNNLATYSPYGTTGGPGTVAPNGALPQIMRGPLTIKTRGWMLTINNPTQEEVELLHNDNKGVIYRCYQFEMGGKENTLHIQAFIYYQYERVWPKKKFPRAHIEPAKNIIAAMKYCMKEETRVQGPYEYGERPQQGKRTDILEIKEMIKNKKQIDMTEIAELYPNQYFQFQRQFENYKKALLKDRAEKPKVYWIWGKSGVGKTHEAIKMSNESFYIKDETSWWDGYEQQETIIIDDFDGKWPFRNLLRLFDGNPYQGQYKGGYVKINSPQIIVTCEFPPNYFWQDGNTLQQVLGRLDGGIIEMRNEETQPSFRPPPKIILKVRGKNPEEQTCLPAQYTSVSQLL